MNSCPRRHRLAILASKTRPKTTICPKCWTTASHNGKCPKCGTKLKDQKIYK